MIFTNHAENCIIELIKKLNLNLPAHPINLFSLRKIGFILKTILKNWSLSLIKIFLLVGFVEVIEQCWETSSLSGLLTSMGTRHTLAISEDMSETRSLVRNIWTDETVILEDDRLVGVA